MSLSPKVTNVLSCIGLSITDAVSDLNLTEDNTILKSIVVGSTQSQLVGTANQAELAQWMSFAQSTFSAEQLVILNNVLLTKSFLVANRVSLADFCVFVSVSENLTMATAFNAYPAIKRWFRCLQSLSKSESIIKFSPTSPTFIPIPSFETVTLTETSVTAPATAVEVSAPAVATTTTDATTTPAATTSSNNKPKKEKAAKTETEATTATTASATTTAAAATASLDPSKLDIRCGLVVKCWDHPESDKLLCEEIDLGAECGGVRTIASGLRAFYSAEQLQGRKVLVLANLKERPMAGFKSQGMVLCAVNADHTQIQLLQVPEGAQIGDRVTFPGFPEDGAAATPAQMAKKKILEGLAPQLRTDAAGVAHWDQSPFTIGTAVCFSGLTDAVVS